MAVPADVIAGEIIEADWGNTIRDFACFGIETGGAYDASMGALTGTFGTAVTVTFTKPSDWVNYELGAWGAIILSGSVGTPTVETRCTIGGAAGTTSGLGSIPTPFVLTVPSRHRVTGLTGNVAVAVEARVTAGASSGLQSLVDFIAKRTA